MRLNNEYWTGICNWVFNIICDNTSSRNVISQNIWTIRRKVNELGKKQDKHNGLIERMVKVESSAASAHHRLDELNHKQEDMEHNCQKILRGRLKDEN